VILNGTNFTGATRVLFNDVPASFAFATNRTLADFQIIANVPADALTGPITIDTPHGNVTTTTNFTILVRPRIAIRPFAPVPSAVGSVGAIAMFTTTLSFLVTTPGAWDRVDGFVFPSDVGGFLIKDVLLLGAALWTLGDALGHSYASRASINASSRVVVFRLRIVIRL
jgi:hypothetical protein